MRRRSGSSRVAPDRSLQRSRRKSDSFLPLIVAWRAEPPTRELRIPARGFDLEQLVREYERLRGIRIEVPETLTDRRRDTELHLSRDLVVEESELDAVLSALLRVHSVAISKTPETGNLRLHDQARRGLFLFIDEPLDVVESVGEAAFACEIVRVPVTFEHLEAEPVVLFLHEELQQDDYTADAMTLSLRTVLVQGEADRVRNWIATLLAAD